MAGPLLAPFAKWGFPRSVAYLSFVWVVVNDAGIAEAEGAGGPATHVSTTRETRGTHVHPLPTLEPVPYMPEQDFRPGELNLFPRYGPENPARDFEPVGTRARRSGGNAHHIALRWTMHFVQRCI